MQNKNNGFKRELNIHLNKIVVYLIILKILKSDKIYRNILRSKNITLIKEIMKTLRTTAVLAAFALAIGFISCDKKHCHRPLPPKPKHECNHHHDDTTTVTTSTEEADT